ncbi:hypothetical protein [Roseibium sp.]|uniref:hypothetical protein n=1 Tax=Roseibium sp. TaxID=1936156 RepID=UPI003BAC20E4
MGKLLIRIRTDSTGIANRRKVRFIALSGTNLPQHPGDDTPRRGLAAFAVNERRVRIAEFVAGLIEEIFSLRKKIQKHVFRVLTQGTSGRTVFAITTIRRLSCPI